MEKVINISSISLKDTTITAYLTIGNHPEELVTTVNYACLPYLCIDRIDAYVMGLMHFALKNGYDFTSTLSISESLYYNLNYHYIDALLDGNPHLHRVKIKAPIIPDMKESDKKGKLVATGISCGVDSLYTIATHTKKGVNGGSFASNPCDSFVVDTLCFFNVGAAMKSADELDNYLSKGRLRLAEAFAHEYNYRFLHVQSNIHFLINKYNPNGYSHVENHTFTGIFCILHLQYGISKYYYSSGYSITDFSINNKNNEEMDAAHYDLFTLTMASINRMRFYSTGSTINRLNKIRLLNSFPPAYKYLNVCVNDVKNDNTCFKCERTLLEIDAVGDINNFTQVFDVEYYKKNKDKYMMALYKKAILKKDHYYLEVYPYFKDEITLGIKLRSVLSIVKNRLSIVKNRLLRK